MATEIIATSRLSLRASVPSDLALLHMHVFSDAEVMRYVLTGVPLTLNQAEDFFDSSFDHHGTGRRLGVLVERSTQAVIGFSGLMPCQALGAEDYELGFVLSRQAWAKGYATEIGFGQIEYGFGVLRCERLLAQVAPGNNASIATLRKIGMHLHGSVDTAGRGTRQIYVTHRPA